MTFTSTIEVELSLSDDLQTKINAATNGDILILPKGTFVLTALLTINKEIEIRGAQYGIPAPGRSKVGEYEVLSSMITDSEETTLACNQTSTLCIDIGSSNALLDGFTITSGVVRQNR